MPGTSEWALSGFLWLSLVKMRHNNLTNALISDHVITQGYRDSHGDYEMTAEADTAVMHLQAKEFQGFRGPPEARRE